MNLTPDRFRSLAWGTALAVCGALSLGLAVKVNAVKSEVRLAERRIAALRQEKLLLETEFETRANQQQLKSLNDVEFGYQAPTSGQYLEGERKLAALGKPRGPGAPEMIRVASADVTEEESLFPAMVSPLTGKAIAAEVRDDGTRRAAVTAATLRERLSTLAVERTAQGAAHE